MIGEAIWTAILWVLQPEMLIGWAVLAVLVALMVGRAGKDN